MLLTAVSYELEPKEKKSVLYPEEKQNTDFFLKKWVSEITGVLKKVKQEPKKRYNRQGSLGFLLPSYIGAEATRRPYTAKMVLVLILGD